MAQIAAAEAVRHFKGVKIQTASAVKVKGADGVKRDAFTIEEVALSAEHVIGAAKRADGTVVIATIDGRKHEARA